MVRPGRRLKPGDSVVFSPDFAADIIDYGKDGTRIVEFHYNGVFMSTVSQEKQTMKNPLSVLQRTFRKIRQNVMTDGKHSVFRACWISL